METGLMSRPILASSASGVIDTATVQLLEAEALMSSLREINRVHLAELTVEI